jgi:hypothetical protein
MLSRVEQEFLEAGQVRGGILFLPQVEAIRLVKRCSELGIEVLGVDSFILTEQTTQPVMEQSIDLSWPARKDTWGEATAFLNERFGSRLMFEIVVGASPGCKTCC